MNQEFEGLVLLVRKYRENDLLVKILTDRFGPVMFFVKGGQMPNHRLRSLLIPFSHQTYIGVINQTGLSFLKEGRTLYLSSKIQEDYRLQAYATYFADLITYQEVGEDHFTPLFRLLVGLLNRLSLEENPHILMLFFEIKLLPFFGSDIDWEKCLVCGRSLGPFDFSVRKRGILCENHWDVDSYRLHMPPKVIEICRRFAYYDLGHIKSFALSEESVKELDRLVGDLYDEFIGIRPKSRRYIEEMEAKEAAFQEMLAQRLKKKD